MNRCRWSLVLVVLAPLGCKHAPPPAGWAPSLVEAEGASWCASDAPDCTPAAAGVAAAGKQLRTVGGGRAVLALDADTTVELGSSSSVALADGTPRVVEIRGGTIAVRRRAHDGDADAGVSPRVAVRIADQLVDFDPRGATSLLVRARGEGRASVTVDRGVATFRRGEEAAIALHAGETAAIASGAPLDRRAGYAGEIARVEGPRRVEAAASSAPRGLGTMAARVPGTEELVSGVRLASHRVHAVVRNGYARTEVEEVFANDGDRPLEGRYVFAVPPRASVGRLALWVGDKLVEDEVVPRAKAASIFKGIVDDTVRPRDPALLEWVASGAVSLKVFPLPPKGSRKIVLAYDEALATQGGEVRYVYPLSLGEARANTIGELAITVDVEGNEAPIDVATPGYVGTTTKTATGSRVAYEAKGASPTADFAVTWREASSAPAEVAAYVQAWAPVTGLGVERITKAAGDGSWAAVRITAGLPVDSAAPTFVRRDRVLIVDKSFSESREVLEAELRVAIGLARALDPDERFAVLACDSTCDSFPESGLAPATEASLESVEKWARSVIGGGSSDVAGAILAATARLEANGAGQLVFLGDGAATSGELTAQTIALRVHRELEAKKIDLRLLGAGATIDAAALESLAIALGATYEPLVTGEPAAARIESLAVALRSPLIHGASITLPASMTEAHPQALPALRLGQQVTVFARLTKPEGEDVKLTGELDGKPYAFATKLAWGTGDARQTPLLPRLWAARRIDELRAIGDPPSQKELIELSQRFHVLTPLTSMLVLENDAMFASFGLSRTVPRSEPSAPSTGAPGALAQDASALSLQSLGALGKGSPLMTDGALNDPRIGGGGLAGIGTGQGTSAGTSNEVRGPKAMVSSGAVTATVPIANAERVLAGARSRVRACYQQGLANDPTMEGRVSVIIVVGPNGEVSSASVAQNGVSPGVGSCIAARMRSLQFEAPGGSGSTPTDRARSRSPRRREACFSACRGRLRPPRPR